MTDLSHTKALIIVFAMPGCPACHDYLPRLTKQINGFKQYKVPFELYDEIEKVPTRIPVGVIPVFVYDATSADETLQQLANQHGITAMPTTLLMSRTTATTKFEGAISDDEIYRVLVAAATANS